MPLTKTNVSTIRQSAQTVSLNSARVIELQKKIQDENYINNAIDRIAVVISRCLVESKTLTGNSEDFLN
ncbi:MAG: hypothetical protein WCQ67_01425 [Treponema sp.]